MKERLLKYLACPACHAALALSDVAKTDGAEIISGQLKCAGCEAAYPIVGGVPRFADLAQLNEEKAATAKGFGWEWTHFSQVDEKYGEQLLGWLNPVKPEFFKDKVVLDGGCGKGRQLFLRCHYKHSFMQRLPSPT